MKKSLLTLTALTLATTTLAPIAGVYADPMDPDPGYDFEACQVADLTGLETHTITFETNGGSVVAPVTVINGCSLYEAGQVPADPTKNGATFFGWFTDSEFTSWKRYNFHEIFDEDTTIYAQFIDNDKIINSINISVEAPAAGTEVTVTENTEQGAYILEQDPRPVATTTDTGYEISYTGYVLESDEWWSDLFEGTFVEGEDYYVNLSLATEGGYRFAPNNLTATINSTPAVAIIMSEYSNGEWANVVARVTAETAVEIQPDFTEITEEDLTEEEVTKISEQLEEGDIVVAYFDIDALVVEGGIATGTIAELDDAIEVAVPMPEGLPEVPAGYTRIFKVIRIHNGVAEVLDAQVSGNTIVFRSDKFSTYAIVYQDVVTPAAPDTGAFNAIENSVSRDSFIVLTILGLSVAGFALVRARKNA